MRALVDSVRPEFERALKRRGYYEVEAERDAACKAAWSAYDEAIVLPAHSTQGFKGKMEATVRHLSMHPKDDYDEQLPPEIWWGLMADIRRLARVS